MVASATWPSGVPEMPNRLWIWLVTLSGSMTGSLLGLVFFALDRTVDLLFFIPVAWLTWIFRPKDWRNSIDAL